MSGSDFVQSELDSLSYITSYDESEISILNSELTFALLRK